MDGTGLVCGFADKLFCVCGRTVLGVMLDSKTLELFVGVFTCLCNFGFWNTHVVQLKSFLYIITVPNNYRVVNNG